MEPSTFSFLGLTFVLVATAGVLAMLEMWGNQQTRFNKKFLRTVHRTCGYLFITIYIVMMYFMLMRVVTQIEPFTPLQAIHITLGVLIFPLLAIKIFIVRRLPELGEKLPYFGVAIFALAFTLNAITAGFYFLRLTNPRYISLQYFDRTKLVPELGRTLMEMRCQKCHTLERVFTSVKTEEEWERTVNAMLIRDPSIRDEEAAQIIFFLASSRGVKQTPDAIRLAGMNLTDTKCGRCHMLEKLYRDKRSAEEWSNIVDWMVDIEPAWISPEEAENIKKYLALSHSAPVRRARFDRTALTETSPTGAEAAKPRARARPVEDIFNKMCTSCHEHDRIHSKQQELGRDRAKWLIIVGQMRQHGAKLSDEEVENMADYLATLPLK